MLKHKDIIIIGSQPWDTKIGSNCKNIAEIFAGQNRVLYVNAPLDRKTRITKNNEPEVKHRLRVLKGKEKDLVNIKDNLWNLNPRFLAESINQITVQPLYDFLNRRNNRKFAGEIKKAARQLGFKDYIVFNDSLMFMGYYLKEYLQPKAYIYYIRDNLVTQDYFRKHGLRMEPELIAKSDAVVANSIYLANYAKKHNPESFMVGQGCDVTHFNDDNDHLTIPEDLKEIKNPIIGYVGFLTSLRLDIDTLVHLAKNSKDKSLVLVGPEDEKFQTSELHQIDNVYFLGSQSPEDLPRYIKGFDVCINPQLVNELTVGNYPRKIDEYLAMGKPVLATPTEAMEYFGDYTYLAPDKDAYVEMADQAIREDSPELRESRKLFARSHTWENNVENISKIIENYI